MPLIRLRREWEIPEREVTPPEAVLNRRTFLRTAGLAGAGLALRCLPGTQGGPPAAGRKPHPPESDPYPAERNPAFTANRPLTPEDVAARYNNFYEFSERKEEVRRLVHRFETHPWGIQVGGLVGKPTTFAVEDLLRKMPLEERVYRFRCVEAWAMVVPWTGFPLRRLMDAVQPLSSARYLRFVSFHRPDQAPGQRKAARYPWPYFEGLTLEEAANDLTLLVSGIFGHPLPKQHGAPIRLIVPWKYGYKSIKSVVRIEFTREQPPTFWNRVSPKEYDFRSNVNPAVPHPRWSQATERMIGTGEIRPTRLYNGYAASVAHLYGT